MEPTVDIVKLVDDYLSGRLPEDEKRELERKLTFDQGFSAEVKPIIASVLGVKLSGQDQFKQNLLGRQRRLTNRQTRQPRKLMWRYIASAAAALLILAAITISIRNLSGTASPEELYISYFELPDIPNYRDDSGQTQVLWKEASMQYASGDYEAAAAGLEALVASGDSNDPSRDAFFLGISYLESGNHKAAVLQFQQVSNESLYSPDSKWYLSLAHLKAGESKRSAEILEEIANTEFHHKRDAAANLLKGIR